AYAAFDSRSVFEPLADGQRGMKAEYFSSDDLTGTPSVTRTDFTINNYWGQGKPIESIKSKTYSVRWTGKIRAPYSDMYTFSCATDGARIALDGKTLFDNWSAGKSGSSGVKTSSLSMHLDSDTTHDITIEYHRWQGPAEMKFSWGKTTPLLTS